MTSTCSASGSAAGCRPSPVVNSEPGTVPFAISFDTSGHLVIAEAGTNALATFTLAASGTAEPDRRGAHRRAGHLLGRSRRAVPVRLQRRQRRRERLHLLGQRPADAARRDADRRGTVDASAAAGGRFLYVQTGGTGIVDEFSVGSSGSLTQIGAVTVPGAAGGEGIVAF